MVGCLAAAIWGGRYGRRAAIAVGCVVTIIGAAMQASSYSVAQMIVARIATGIGNGVSEFGRPPKDYSIVASFKAIILLETGQANGESQTQLSYRPGSPKPQRANTVESSLRLS